jgi:hypothetical protein
MLERNILADIDCRGNRASRRQIQGNHSGRADSIRRELMRIDVGLSRDRQTAVLGQQRAEKDGSDCWVKRSRELALLLRSVEDGMGAAYSRHDFSAKLL